MSSPQPTPPTYSAVHSSDRATHPACSAPAPDRDHSDAEVDDLSPTGPAWEGVSTRNPSRSAFSPEVQKLAVTAVAELLADTTLSLTSAAAEVAANIGAGTSSVLRWCKAAGVSREAALVAHERQWQARVSVLRNLNSRLAAVASGHNLPERAVRHPLGDDRG